MIKLYLKFRHYRNEILYLQRNVELRISNLPQADRCPFYNKFISYPS